MWCGLTLTWDAGDSEMLHSMNTTSYLDCHYWTHEGLAVHYELGVAKTFSRPTVIPDF